jgi:RNA polymerase sigma-70 factor (ECF subfamily)
LIPDSSRSERFVRHLEPLRGVLEGFCRRALLNASDVEDVLQAAVLQALRDFHLYVENTNFRAWIFRYVRLEVCNCNRRQQRQAESLAGAEQDVPAAPAHPTSIPAYERLLEAPDLVLENCETELAQAVRELPEGDREVLLLRAVGEFKYREIAEILEIPVGTVMGRLSRARAGVRRRLAELGLDGGQR